ncbi:peroxidasin homolog [Mantella aurantiaca]
MELCVLWSLANIFLFNALHVDGSLPIPVLHFEDNIIEDEDTKITCTLPCSECPDTKLVIKGNVTMRDCVSVQGIYPNVTCTVEVTREMHEMEFTCEAEFKTQSLPTKMNIQTDPEFTDCPQRLVWLDGQETGFHCKAKGYPQPTVTCQKNNTIYQEGEKFIAKRNMSGEYICRATNFDTVTKPVMVSVEYKPQITQSVKVNPPLRAKGDQVEITCEANGLPIPTYSWNMPSSDVQLSPDNRTVTIQSLKESHLGNYTCIVQNKHGTNHAQATLEIAVKPKILGFIIAPSPQVLEGDNVTMYCEATGFPTPVLSWGNLKPDMEMSKDKRTVRIFGVKKEHEGPYSCEAKNKYGTDKQTQSLSLGEKPKILQIKVQPSTTVEGGANVTLTCEANGLPSPTFSWNTQAPDVQLSDDKRVLYIRNAKKIHDAVYECKVENKYGSDTQTMKISVKGIALCATSYAANLSK